MEKPRWPAPRRPKIIRLLSAAVLSLCATASASSSNDHGTTIPFPHKHNPHVLLSMPSANVLGHYQYMLAGRFQYFNTATLGDDAGPDSGKLTEVSNMTYDSELLLGVENRAELGVSYGHELALSIKALLVREDIFWPDLVFGVRNILGSPEAGLYAVEDEDLLQALLGESYVTVGKSFPSSSRLHFGISYLSRAEKGNVGVNAGLEQDLGAGAYLGYEVFERFSDFHQVLSLNWRYKDFVALSIGLTEFQSWIRQDGEWGLFYSPSKERPDGYNAPGITVNLQVLGHVPRRQKRTLPERVAIMEVRNAELERRLVDVQEALLRSEARAMDCSNPCRSGGATAAAVDPETLSKVKALLQGAADQMNMEVSDPEEVRKIMLALVNMGPAAAEILRAAAADPAAGQLRIPALLTMAFSRDSSHAPSLRALLADPDARIRREALTALTKVQPQGALEDARKLIDDPDEGVAMAAGEAYRILGGEPLPGKAKPAAKPAPNAAPAKPKAPAKGGRSSARSAAKAPATAAAGHGPEDHSGH